MDTIQVVQRKQRLVWGAATFLIVLLGLAQRDQRGLLSGPETAASAFAAITPQSPGIAMTGIGLPGRGGQPGIQRLIGRTGGGGAPQFTDSPGTMSSGAGAPLSAFDPQNQPATPSALLALADPDGGGGINPGPGLGGSLPGISPAGPQQTASSTAPGAVPEAPIWAIMILGIGGIGCMARRERSRGRSFLKTQPA